MFVNRSHSPNAYGRAQTSGITLQDDAFGNRAPPRSMSMQFLGQQQQQPSLHQHQQHQHHQHQQHQSQVHSAASMNALSSQMGGLGLGAQASNAYYEQAREPELDPIRKVASVNSLFPGPFSASAHELQMQQQHLQQRQQLQQQQQAQMHRNDGFGFFHQSVNSESDRAAYDYGDGPAF